MDDGRKAALRQKREDLRTGIRVKDIFPDLHEAVGGFLDDVGEDKVRSKENNVEQVDELIDILLMKENKDFDYFCTVVEKGNRTRANNLRQAAGLGKFLTVTTPCTRPITCVCRRVPVSLARQPLFHGCFDNIKCGNLVLIWKPTSRQRDFPRIEATTHTAHFSLVVVHITSDTSQNGVLDSK